MSKMYHVYGVGNALVDTEVEVSDGQIEELKIQKGHMTLIDQNRWRSLVEGLKGVRHKRACGGSAANTLIGTSQLGGKCFYSCKVASDETGTFYVDDLKNNGVLSNSEGVRSKGVTGQCLVLVTPDAERTMETFLGITATLSKEDLVESELANSEYVYIEGYLVAQDKGREAMRKAKELAMKNGVKTALTLSDPSMVKFFGEELHGLIGSGMDLLFCNEAEALGLTHTDDVYEAKEALRKMAKHFVVTLGARGALVFDGKQFYDIPAHPVKAVDTNGAGDMFAGAFLYGISHHYDYLTAGRLAALCSAKVVSQFGPRLKKEETQRLLKQIIG